MNEHTLTSQRLYSEEQQVDLLLMQSLMRRMHPTKHLHSKNVVVLYFPHMELESPLV